MTTLQIINQFVAFSLRQIIQQDSQAAIVQYANVIICTNIDALYNPTIYIIVKLFTTTYSSMVFLMFCRRKLKSCHFYPDRNPCLTHSILKKQNLFILVSAILMMMNVHIKWQNLNK